MTIDTARVSPIRAALVLGSLAVVSAGLTVLFLSMRAVMDIGGVCASGATPYEISRPCPDGIPILMIGGIWLGVIAAIVYFLTASSARIPSLAGLLWPALFISLGFNFLQYAFNPPEGDGIVWGWLIPGVLFMLMGAVPLWLWLSVMVSKARAGDVAEPTSLKMASLAASMRQLRDPRSPVAAPTQGIVDELERLDALHRSGAISDSEFEKAKRRLLT